MDGKVKSVAGRHGRTLARAAVLLAVVPGLADGQPYPPSAPQGVTAQRDADSGDVTVRWWPPPDTGGPPIEGYRVYRMTSYNDKPDDMGRSIYNGTVELLGNVSGLAYLDPSVPNPNGTSYRVTAVSAGGESTPGLWVTWRNPFRPDPPRVSGGPGPGLGEIHLGWKQDCGQSSCDQYRIYRSNGTGQPYVLIGTDSRAPCHRYTAGNPSGFCTYKEADLYKVFKDRGHANGTSFSYRVSTVDDLGTTENYEGNLSEPVNVTTYAMPEPISDLRALPVAETGGSITLHWNWSAPGEGRGGVAVSYKIYRSSTAGGPYAFLAESKEYGQTYTYDRTYNDLDLPALTTFYYRVSAVNPVGEGPQSEEANATVPRQSPPSFPPWTPPPDTAETPGWEAAGIAVVMAVASRVASTTRAGPPRSRASEETASRRRPPAAK